MWEKTQQLLKKFEQEHEIYVDATDARDYWIIHARIPKVEAGEDGPHHLHLGKKYVSGPDQDGSVLVIPDSQISNAYQVESWGKLESFDDFVNKGLASILEEKDAMDKGQKEGCGTSCG